MGMVFLEVYGLHKRAVMKLQNLAMPMLVSQLKSTSSPYKVGIRNTCSLVPTIKNNQKNNKKGKIKNKK